jgi:aryl-alcohol dehydrogenase-like predicted oxidoreductase
MKSALTLVDLLSGIAQRKNATLAQIALAWLLAQKLWIVPFLAHGGWSASTRISAR